MSLTLRDAGTIRGLVSGVCAVGWIGSAVIYVTTGSDQGGRPAAILLFTAGIVGTISLAALERDATLERRFAVAQAVIGSGFVYWLVYRFNPGIGTWISLASFGHACLVVAIAVIATWILMCPDTSTDNRRRLCERAKAQGFWTLAFFFGTFLAVTVLLAFSVAFHDKANADRSLYQSKTPTVATYTSRSICATFFFADNSAYVELPPDTSKLAARDPFPSGCDASTQVEAVDKKHLTAPDGSEDRRAQARWLLNGRALGLLQAQLAGVNEDARITIKLTGHSSDRPLRDSATRFRSNWELSLARVIAVQDILHTRLHKYDIQPTRFSESDSMPTESVNVRLNNIDWVLTPMATEGRAARAAIPVLGANLVSEQRSVVVTGEILPLHPSMFQFQAATPVEDKSLLDYLYFVIATGDNDMVPSAPATKFFVAAASIFHVFYLVIFFNVIVATSTTRVGSDVQAIQKAVRKELAAAGVSSLPQS